MVLVKLCACMVSIHFSTFLTCISYLVVIKSPITLGGIFKKYVRDHQVAEYTPMPSTEHLIFGSTPNFYVYQ